MHSFSTSKRFANLEPRDRDRLEALSKLDQFAAGAEILTSEKPAEWLSLIADGEVEMRALSPRGEIVFARLLPGDLFGELEGFAHLPGGVRHVAVRDTIVRAIPKSPLLQELRSRRQLASGMLSVYCRSISEKLRAANEVAARLPREPGVSRPPLVEATTPQDPKAGPLGRAPHLSAEESGWLAVLGQARSAAAGEVIIAEGEESRSFYVVEKGLLEVRKQLGGEARVLAQLADRDLFGFMAFVDGKPRSASVVALAPCSLVRIEQSALEKALRLNFTVSFKFLGTLCSVLGRTLRETTQKVISG